MTSFALFPLLPLEIRQKIWFRALPGARVLLVKLTSGSPKRIDRRGSFEGDPITSPASYGGHHPAILSVSKESRAEALHYLTPLLGAYWNLDIDTPYFELPEGDNSRNEVLLIPELRKAGLLDPFQHIAIDWAIWDWSRRTHTMEFQVTFGRWPREAYEHPIQTMNALPNLKTCSFVRLDHTVQKDLTIPYCPWHLGPLSMETTLDANNLRLEEATTKIMQEIDAKREEIQNIGNLAINVLSIHGRAREDLPQNQLKRRIQGWEMDWFG